MIYEKSDLVKTAQWKPIYESGRLYENGTKPFDDLIIDANHTMKTHYTVKTYTIIDNSTGKPITMNIGDTLIVYYQLIPIRHFSAISFHRVFLQSVLQYQVQVRCP